MAQIFITRPGAYGNGNRFHGDVIGTSKDGTLDNVELAAGATADEIACLRLNPDCFEIGTPPNRRTQMVPAKQSAKPLAWRDMATTAIGLNAKESQPFLDAGLMTAGEIADYGDKHEGLKSIAGVGDKLEDKVAEILAKLAPPDVD